MPTYSVGSSDTVVVETLTNPTCWEIAPERDENPVGAYPEFFGNIDKGTALVLGKLYDALKIVRFRGSSRTGSTYTGFLDSRRPPTEKSLNHDGGIA